MTRSNCMKKKSAALTLLGSVALIISIAASANLVEAKSNANSHEPDISHPEGTSPWPNYGERPDTNTPEVKAWVKSIDWSKVPNLPVRKTESMGDPPECAKNDQSDSDCWWTCTGCHAPDDVVECPNKNDWGLTFDDGPQPGVTEDLLDLLTEKNVTATLFVTGMKSTKGHWLLNEALGRGHHLASHTWSHSGLTTLTNEQIVGELMWTQKYIYDHTGYKVKYFRPPYGDVDNRVREIARQLGFKTVIWTSEWDMQDWQLEENTITPKKIEGIFSDDLKKLPSRTNGVITLQHDSDIRMVSVARTLLDMGLKEGMKPMNIAQCLNDKVGYIEVPGNPEAAQAPTTVKDSNHKEPLVPARQPIVKTDADPSKASTPPKEDKNKNGQSDSGTITKQEASGSIPFTSYSVGLYTAGLTLAAIAASFVF
ncbi:chitin deacetylase [Haplosporangium sp. Z 11]|nr:chitin deacetylase [Haplosporangium sp. Z 11]